MGCTSCSPGGCGNKGHCSSGGCNKMNTYDWINTMDISDPTEYKYVEVSFKNGSRKEFYKNEDLSIYSSGDTVLVEAQTGYDIGQISLMGEMVRLQMKKKYTTEDRINHKVIRIAHERDLEKLGIARNLEKGAMVRARAITKTFDLDMKVGDVEYQGDMRKATFYYTANGRVDFRELVRAFAKEFRVKIEMRQIGSRQESARIGGLGSCGRELCCSTWLSDFRSVNTSAARYQNISINQTKLSGQCGRLKCCLNYELDSYMDALKSFPKRADVIETKKGRANLMKTDIFKGIMHYSYADISMRGVFHPITKEKVKEILDLNKNGILPENLTDFYDPTEPVKEIDFDDDVTGVIELPLEKRRKKKRNNSRRNQKPKSSNNQNRQSGERGKSNNKPQRNTNKREGQKPNSNNGKPHEEKKSNNRPERSNQRGPKKGGPNKGNQNKGGQNKGGRPNGNNPHQKNAAPGGNPTQKNEGQNPNAPKKSRPNKKRNFNKNRNTNNKPEEGKKD